MPPETAAKDAVRAYVILEYGGPTNEAGDERDTWLERGRYNARSREAAVEAYLTGPGMQEGHPDRYAGKSLRVVASVGSPTAGRAPSARAHAA